MSELQAKTARFVPHLFDRSRIVPFGELVENLDGRRVPLKQDSRKKGIYPYYGASGIIDYVERYLFDGEYLLIAEDGANLIMRSSPIAFRASGRFWVNNHAHVVKPKPGVDMDYLIHFFAATDITTFVTGAAQPKLSQAKLNQIPVPLPPFEEQVRISSLLNEYLATIDRARAAATAQLKAAAGLIAGYFAQTFPKLGASAPPKWCWAALSDLATEIYRYPSFYGFPHENEGVPVIRGEHIGPDGYISTDWSDYWFVTPEISSAFPRTVLKEGDLLYSVRGTIGKIGLVGPQHSNAQVSPNLLRIAPNHYVDSTYLWLYLRFLSADSRNIKSNAVTIATVKASDIAQIQIPVPPLAEQQQIAASVIDQLAQVDVLQSALETQLDAIDALPAALLHQAFNGEL